MDNGRSIFSLVREDSRNWWYHAKLRKEGQEDEARKREHKSARDRIQMIRDALAGQGFCSVGRGGASIKHPTRSGEVTHQTYGGPDSNFVLLAIRMGVPTIDSTTIPDDRIMETIKLPMARPWDTDEPREGERPYGSCSFAPLDYVAREYEKLGATLYNMEV